MRLSFTQESDFRRQRDFGQKFSATFEFIGAHWRGLWRAILYIVLPAALLRGIMAGLLQRQLAGVITRNVGVARSGGGALAQLSGFSALALSPIYWVSAALSVMFAMLLILTVYSYMRCCLRPVPTGEPITVREVWTEVRQHFFSAFLSYIGLGIFLLIGFVFFFVPGVYLSVPFSLFFVVMVMENTGFSATLSRCLQLIKGKWWSTVGLLFIMLLMLWVLLLALTAVIGFASYGLSSGMGLYSSGDSTALSLLSIVTSTLTSLFALLVYPSVFVALAFQYFNLVERHDGVGLRNMVNQLGQSPASVQNATYQPEDEGEY